MKYGKRYMIFSNKHLLFGLVLCLFQSAACQNLAVTYRAEDALNQEQLALFVRQADFESRRAVDQHTQQIINELQLIGYIDAVIKSPLAKNQMTHEVVIDLGQKWETITLSVPENLVPIVHTVADNDQRDDTTITVALSDLPGFINRLSDEVAKEHDPFSKISIRQIEKTVYPKLSGILYGQLEQKRTIDAVIIKGYTEAPKGVLRHQGGMKIPLPFDPDVLSRLDQEIDQIPYITRMRASEVLFEEDQTTLYLNLGKKNNNSFDGLIGFATNPETQKLSFNGYLKIDLSNNLNLGEQLNVDFKGDGQEQQRIGINTQWPFIFGTPFGVTGQLDLFRKDSLFTTAQTMAALDYQMTSRTAWHLGHKVIESRTGTQEDIRPDLTDFKTELWLLGFSAEQRQNNLLFPQKYLLDFESAFGKRTNQAGRQGQNRFQFVGLYQMDLSQEHKIFLQNTTAYISGGNISTNEAYRFGGIQSLRGFNENTIEASALSLLNIEYRLVFNETFYLHHISDMAIFKEATSSSKTNFLFGLGFGLASQTRAGLLKLQIAQGFGQNNAFDLGQTKVHIAFASQF